GQFNISFLGARGFFEEKKFNLYMGAGALGGTMSDFARDNFDHADVDFINGGAIEIRQYGDGAIASNHVPNGTPGWRREFKKNSIHYSDRVLHIRYIYANKRWCHNDLDLDPTHKDEFGDPLIRVTNKATDRDRNMAQFGIEKCKEIIEEMGADIADLDE